MSGPSSAEDPLRTYSPGELERLTRQLRALLERVHAGEFRDQQHAQRLLCELHAGIFLGVRDHAGKVRRRSEGSERLTFGPHRSAHRDEVEPRLARLFDQLERSLRSLDDNPKDPDYELGALHVAVWAHAEIIRVHPFEDGNGRSSRAFMSAILVRQGLRPIAVEATKEEYISVLNHYLQANEIRPLLDLFLRLADEQLDGPRDDAGGLSLSPAVPRA